MKKIILLSAVTLLMYSAQAQTNGNEQNVQSQSQQPQKRNGKPMPTPQQKASKFLNKIDSQLKLNAEQKATISSLANNHFNELEQARVKEDEAKKQMRASRINFEDGVRKTLTPEQFKAWEQKRKEHHEMQNGKPELPKE